MRVDPSLLKGPLYKLLDRLWKGPRDEYEGWDKRLSAIERQARGHGSN
jgi:hypothetical protein